MDPDHPDEKATVETIQIRSEVLNRLKSVLSDGFYRDAIENSCVYNTRLVKERKLRLPFLDAQTGVAQSDCYIWMNKWERMPHTYESQLYSYPTRRWRKKRRQYLLNDNYLAKRNPTNEVAEIETHHVSLENGNKTETVESIEKFYENSKEAWYQDYDDGSDLPDAGELDDPESDYDDYEEYSTRKKKKKKDTPKRKRVEYSDAEKPYCCDICGARYKTRPGLSYHYSHSHQSDSSTGSRAFGLEDDDMPYTPPRQIHHQSQPQAPQVQPPNPQSLSDVAMSSSGQPSAMVMHHREPAPMPQLTPHHRSVSQMPSSVPPPQRQPPIIDDSNGEEPYTSTGFAGQRSASGKSAASPSTYCDFCLGDSGENKKTKSAEELVSCSDCGRSAHPSCLQFTANMTASVKKYRWQCIECKSCGLCGTSDNDDQLLFCDDCDRGYHMYCLNPPLSEPPEGSWSCHLCIIEYHTPKK